MRRSCQPTLGIRRCIEDLARIAAIAGLAACAAAGQVADRSFT
jgi:hypothetical protein